MLLVNIPFLSFRGIVILMVAFLNPTELELFSVELRPALKISKFWALPTVETIINKNTPNLISMLQYHITSTKIMGTALFRIIK
jgi:hypothetical protein